MEDDEDVKDEQFQYYDDELSISNRIVYNEAKGFEKIRKMIKKSIRYDLNELEYEEEYEIDRLNKEIKDILSILTKEEQKEVEYNIKYMFIDISKSSFEDLKQYYEDLERINYSLERRLMVKKGTKILTFRLKSKKSNRK
jgi:hypothetical protein